MTTDHAEHLWRHPYAADTPKRIAAETLPAFHIMSGILDGMPDCPQKWAAAIGTGATGVCGRTLPAMAAVAGIKPGALLKLALKFCTDNAVNPSPHLHALAKQHAKDRAAASSTAS